MKIENLTEKQLKQIALELHDMNQLVAPAKYKQSDLMRDIFFAYYINSFGDTFDTVSQMIKSEIYNRYIKE